MNVKSIGFIGGGRVVKIILKAMQNAGAFPEKVIASDINEGVLSQLKNEFPSVTVTNYNPEPANCDYVFISLHPPVMAKVMEEIKSVIKPGAVIISLAPKVTIPSIISMLNGYDKIVRMIPNAPSYINKGYNPVSYSGSISPSEKEKLAELFAILGEAPEVDEYNLEGYAITAAMGPTYLWFQLKKLHELGKSFGLSEEELQKAIKAMVKGAVDTLYDSGLSADEVIDLIPVKPLAEYENLICGQYDTTLTALFNRLKG